MVVTYCIFSAGLIDQINNFKTLSLSALPFTDPFLIVYEDYFYHTANPRRPEVKTVSFLHNDFGSSR